MDSPTITAREEHWIEKYWRPALAWQYVVVCLFDFMLAPMLMVLYSYITKTTLVPWVPLTLQGGSMYHFSMGAVTGVTSWTRGNEKMATIDAFKAQNLSNLSEGKDNDSTPTR